MLKIGNINKLKVNRKTDIGYVLDAPEGEVFLHNNESLHMDLKPFDVVEAFLYFDHKGRLAATLKQPYVTTDTQSFLVVKDINPSLGAFLDMGINKDLLLSKDDLPLDTTKWPQPGDKVLVTIKVKNRLVASIVPKTEIKLVPERELQVKDQVTAYVQKIGREGLNLYTPDGHFIFVHHTMYKDNYRIGQEVVVKITYYSDKGYSGSLIKQKEQAIQSDAEVILEYLKKHKEMPLDADSTPEKIYDYFKMSKKAFKRAIGNLYKNRNIEFKEGKTFLIK
jgi:predicted RNA-binding protein (virulence factor B family)